MTWTQRILYVLAGCGALALSFVAGRYTSPTKTETHTEYVDRFQIVEHTMVQRVTDTKWKRVVQTKPDGSSTVIETGSTHEAQTSASSAEVTKTTTAVVDEKKTVAAGSSVPNWTIAVLVGGHLVRNSDGVQIPALEYGLYVDRKLLGPIVGSAFILSSGTLGLGAGVRF